MHRRFMSNKFNCKYPQIFVISIMKWCENSEYALQLHTDGNPKGFAEMARITARLSFETMR